MRSAVPIPAPAPGSATATATATVTATVPGLVGETGPRSCPGPAPGAGRPAAPRAPRSGPSTSRERRRRPTRHGWLWRPRTIPDRPSRRAALLAVAGCGVALFMVAAWTAQFAALPEQTAARLSVAVVGVCVLLCVRAQPRGIWACSSVYLLTLSVFHFGIATLVASDISFGHIRTQFDFTWLSVYPMSRLFAVATLGAVSATAGVALLTGLAALRGAPDGRGGGGRRGGGRRGGGIGGGGIGGEARPSTAAGPVAVIGRPDLRAPAGFLLLAVSVLGLFAVVVATGGIGLLFGSYADAGAVALRNPLVPYTLFGIGLGLVLLVLPGPGRWRMAGLVVFACFAAVALPLGLRGEVMFPAVAAAAAAGRRRILVPGAVALLGAVFLFAFIGGLREIRQSGLEGARLDAITFSPVDGVAELGASIRPVGAVLEWRDGLGEPAAGGATFYGQLVRLVSGRVLGNPQPSQFTDDRLFNVLVLHREGPIGGSPIAEAYYNFGTTGVVVFLLLTGLAVAWLDHGRSARWTETGCLVMLVPLIIEVRNFFAAVPFQIMLGLALLGLLRGVENLAARPAHARPAHARPAHARPAPLAVGVPPAVRAGPIRGAAGLPAPIAAGIWTRPGPGLAVGDGMAFQRHPAPGLIGPSPALASGPAFAFASAAAPAPVWPAGRPRGRGRLVRRHLPRPAVSVGRAGATVTAWLGLAALASLGQAMLTARMLSVAGRGELVVLLTVSGLGAIFAGLGTNVAFRHFLGRADPRVTLGDYLALTGAVTGPAVVITLIIAVAVLRLSGGSGPGPGLLLAIGGVAAANLVAAQVLDAVNATGAVVTAAVLTAVTGLAQLGLLLAGPDHPSLARILLVLATGWTAQTVACLVVLRRAGLSLRPRFDLRVWRLLVGKGVPALGLNIGATMAFRLDRVLVAAFGGAAAAGVYSVASATGEALRLVPGSVGQVVFARSARGTMTWPQIRAARLRLLAMLAAAAVVLAAAAPWLVRVLFGPEYGGAVTPMRLLLLAELVLAPCLIDLRALSGLGRTGEAGTAGLVGLAVSVVAYPVLVPWWGATGAAVASIAAYAAMTALAARSLRRAFAAAESARRLGPPPDGRPRSAADAPRCEAGST